MKVSHHFRQLVAIGCLFLFILPLVTIAATEVETRVNARAESGTQSVVDGRVETGDQAVEVNVQTIVNGQPVEPINLTLPTENGSTTVTVEQSTSAGSNTAPTSQTEVTVNGQQVVPGSPLPSDSDESNPPSSPSLFNALMDWMKELWHNIIELFS